MKILKSKFSKIKMVYAAVFLPYLIMLIYWGLISSETNSEIFNMSGFSQLKHIGWSWTIVSFIFIIIFIFIFSRYSTELRKRYETIQRVIFSNEWVAVTIAILSSLVFFLLRNNFLNSDGRSFTAKFKEYIPKMGALVTHDEMWELYVHSRFWHYTNQWFDCSVVLSYQLLSSVAGGLFIYLLIRYSKLLLPNRALGFFLIVISGGYMQLFFGDVENYTLTATLILAYFFASYLYLEKQNSLILPSAVLASAMTFHLLAGFLLPSLLYLFFLEFRDRRYANIVFAIILFVSIVGGTLVFFHFHGLPIRNLYFNSHALGHGGNFGAMLVTPSVYYYSALLSLFFLLVPAALLIIPEMLLFRIKLLPVNIHLIIASVFMLIYMIAWEAKLGIYNDWNLFAAVAIPISIFVGFNILSQEKLKEKLIIILPAVCLFFLHSLIWIVVNHLQ